MALIYTKLTDKTTVLAPREGACRKFNFGTDWTEIRAGIFCSAIAATGSNDNNVAETVIVSTVADLVTFGIKDDSQTYPGQVGSTFIGVRGSGTASVSNVPNNGFRGDTTQWKGVGYYGTTEVLSSGITGGGGSIGGATTSSGTSAYAAFFGMKLNINNRGLSTQSIDVRLNFDTIAGTDYSATALRTQLNNASYGTAASFDWNDGASARAIPDCVWVRMPFFLNQLRISAIRAIRYAP